MGLQRVGHTERLHFHFALSCIGEGNGNYSRVLAWRIPGTGEPGGLPSMGSHGVRTRLKRLSSSSSSSSNLYSLFLSSSQDRSPPISKWVLCQERVRGEQYWPAEFTEFTGWPINSLPFWGWSLRGRKSFHKYFLKWWAALSLPGIPTGSSLPSARD